MIDDILIWENNTLAAAETELKALQWELRNR